MGRPAKLSGRNYVSYRLAAQRAAAAPADTHAVVQCKKNGDLYAKPHSTHPSFELAVQEMCRISNLNPNSTFVVRNIDA